jgi:hypothetical protein
MPGARSSEDEHAEYAREWGSVPPMTRNYFHRWWWRTFGPSPRPWFPPFAVAAALPDSSLRRIPGIGPKGVRAIRNAAVEKKGAT